MVRKTNKEKALEYLDKCNCDLEDSGIIYLQDAKEAVELAATPDWYYPSKGELPSYSEPIWCNIDRAEFTDYMILYYIGKNTWITTSKGEFNSDYDYFKDSHITAWTYLPKFEKE